MKKWAYFLFIVFEALAIYILLTFISQKTKSTQVQITPIDRKSVKYILAGDLTNYYEPIPNTNLEETISFLDTPASQTINSDTLNERFDYAAVKENGVFRIITLGDSFTYGAFVDTNKNWTEQLEDSLNESMRCDKVSKYEVINLGVEGYDLAYETERYINRGAKYDPDLVLILIIDFGRVREYRLQKKGTITLTEKEIDEYKKRGKYYIEPVLLNNQIPLIDQINYQKKYFNNLLKVYSGPLLLIDYQKSDEFSDTINSLTQLRSNIVVEKTHMSYKNKSLLFPDGHPNIDGHNKLKEEFLEMLTQKKLLPCP